jgi:hypothetical protein
MKNTVHTFLIISKSGAFKVEDYSTSSGELADALRYAKSMNSDAMVIPKEEIDAQQQFKPFDIGFKRGTLLGIFIGFGVAAILFGLMTLAYTKSI